MLTADDLLAAQRLVCLSRSGDAVAVAILKLVRAGRPNDLDDPEIRNHLSWGPAPRQPGADVGHARPRAYQRPVRAVDRRCHRTRAASPRHRMALDLSTRGPHYGRRRHRASVRATGVRAPHPAVNPNLVPPAYDSEPKRARISLLPLLLVKAERVATIIAQGEHGRCQKGRAIVSAILALPVGRLGAEHDWRQSAKTPTACRSREQRKSQNVGLQLTGHPR